MTKEHKINQTIQEVYDRSICNLLQNTYPNEVILEFIKNLWKFRCILQSLLEKSKAFNLDDSPIQINPFPTPNKRL